MQKHLDKSRDNNTESAAGSLVKNQQNSRPSFQLMDNRPSSLVQKKLTEKEPVQLVKNTYKNQSLITNYFPSFTNKVHKKDHKQPLITNYFGKRTDKLFEQTKLPYTFNPENVVIKGEGNDFTASVKGLGELGELELYDGEGKKWINQIHVDNRAKRRGVGASLLQEAINQYGTIYASTQPADQDNGDDTRHLTDEGEMLVNGCIKKGMRIIKAYPGL